jgi:pantoate kinase
MKGLDSDVSTAVSALSESAQRSAIFGTSSSMITDYYRNLQLVNQVKQSKEEYDNAYTEAKSKQGLGEIATTSQGGVIVKNKEGKLLTITPEEFAKDPSKYSVQTNGNILYERAHNKTFAGQDSLTTIV